MTWAPDYATSQELKDFVRIADDQDDAQVALAVTAASRAVDRSTGRQFGQVDAPEDRFYRAEWYQPHANAGHWLVEIDDLMDSDITVTVDDTVFTEWTLLDRNAAAKGVPWTRIRLHTPSWRHVHPDREVTVHAPWGWTVTPDTIKAATLLQGSRYLARRDSPFGVAGSPEAGNEIRLLPKLDPDVALMVRSYYRWWGAR